ncbi:hypothetical protein CRM22_007043 [Opisthorchis felineus]|uniref:Uncharacterized protein n=1 Tax=Opisthorchis felineus TaxID=147828 RepID=A0A4S2LIA2_OPIFE|nr:hypothetical protein CRM22_007043 [Opisthorchis felineus]
MTLLGGFGCALIGLGPCVSLFILTVACNPLKVIVLTAGGFFWLLSLLLTSLFWLAFSSVLSNLALSLFVAVASQELLRFAFFKLIVLADNGLRVIAISAQTSVAPVVVPRPPTRQPTEGLSNTTALRGASNQEGAVPPSKTLGNDGLLDHRIVAYVSGLGFGLMTCIFELLRILIDAWGPGIGFEVWEAKTFYPVAAFQVMCTSLMHIFWSVILFAAFERRDYVLMVLVYATHLAVPYLSFLNQLHPPWPELVCLFYVMVLVGLAFLARSVVAGKRFTCCGVQPPQAIAADET